MTFYNENDRYAAQWLRNLMAAGHISEGTVDERDIRDVRPADLAGVRVAHFFAGIGGWDLALRIAGVADAKLPGSFTESQSGEPQDEGGVQQSQRLRTNGTNTIWTGSCPCQPFSVAGKRRGTADDRHLWPVWRELIADCRPAIVFGEQVASEDGRVWLAGVRADLEAMGYAVGAADLCAASVGAPHIRQRLWWVAVADGWISSYGQLQRGGRYLQQPQDEAAGGLADAEGRTTQPGQPVRSWESDARQGGRLGDSGSEGLAQRQESEGRGAMGNPWSAPGQAITLDCVDGVTRRTQPGIHPLAHGVSARVGRLRAYGNAIVPQVAAEFVMAFFEAPA